MSAADVPALAELDVDEFVLDEDRASWFELLTGIRLLLDKPRHCCPRWVLHGRTCAWNHSCRQYDSTLDHPVQAIDAAGNRAVLLAPYRFRPGVEVVELEDWCRRHSATWEIVPESYWAPATTSVVVRHAEASGRPWRHYVPSDVVAVRQRVAGEDGE